MLRQAVVLLALVAVCSAAQALAKHEAKPDKFKDVEGCYIKQLDEVIPFGKSVPSKESCMLYICNEKYVIHEMCSAAAVKPPFVLVEDKTKPYPDCCPKPSRVTS